jgi:hypothetical protein
LGRVGFEITGFGTGCKFFCLSIQGFWMWTGKNFVKKQAWVSFTLGMGTVTHRSPKGLKRAFLGASPGF